MSDGLYTDRNADLWYVSEGLAQAVDWGEISDAIPQVTAVLLFGPLWKINDTRE